MPRAAGNAAQASMTNSKVMGLLEQPKQARLIRQYNLNDGRPLNMNVRIKLSNHK
jgi:hypothetical protein